MAFIRNQYGNLVYVPDYRTGGPLLDSNGYPVRGIGLDTTQTMGPVNPQDVGYMPPPPTLTSAPQPTAASIPRLPVDAQFDQGASLPPFQEPTPIPDMPGYGTGYVNIGGGFDPQASVGGTDIRDFIGGAGNFGYYGLPPSPDLGPFAGASGGGSMGTGGYGGGSFSTGGQMPLGGYGGSDPLYLSPDYYSIGGGVGPYTDYTGGSFPAPDPYSGGSPSVGGTDIGNFGGDMSLGADLPSATDAYLGIPGDFGSSAPAGFGQLVAPPGMPAVQDAAPVDPLDAYFSQVESMLNPTLDPSLVNLQPPPPPAGGFTGGFGVGSGPGYGVTPAGFSTGYTPFGGGGVGPQFSGTGGGYPSYLSTGGRAGGVPMGYFSGSALGAQTGGYMPVGAGGMGERVRTFGELQLPGSTQDFYDLKAMHGHEVYPSGPYTPKGGKTSGIKAPSSGTLARAYSGTGSPRAR